MGRSVGMGLLWGVRNVIVGIAMEVIVPVSVN